MKLVVSVLAILALVRADDPEIAKVLSKGINGFSNQMLLEVAKESPRKSVIISGISVLIPLVQLNEASTGETHDELLKSMGIPNDDFAKAAFPLLKGRLRGNKTVVLETANKIYIPQNYELNDEFADFVLNLHSEVQNIDFNKKVESAKEINGWVEDQTNKHIKNFINAESLGNNTRILLVCAIYFKGLWEHKFNNQSTKNRDFHISKDKTIKVPTMYQNNVFNYYFSSNLDSQILEMPYNDGVTSLLILLPKEIDGLPALEQKLKDPSLLENAIKSMNSIKVNVYLPKFKIETTTNLKKILPKMGVKNIFDADKAKLTKLLKTNDTLYVTDAIQKSFFEVNEEGTEAAVANDFIISHMRPMAPKPNEDFVANHPFIFIMKQGNDIVFNGIYAS